MTRQVRAEATRGQILAAAGRIFAEVGYSGANINEIVSQAEVTKGALYFHFESKEVLALALIAERDVRLAQAFDSVDESPIPALEKLMHCSIAICTLATTDVFFQAGARLVLEVGDCAGATARSLGMPLERVTDWFATAREEGDVLVADPGQAAHLLLAQFVGSGVLVRTGELEFDLLSYIEQIWAMTICSSVSEPVRPYFRQVMSRLVATQRSKEKMAVVGG